MVDKANFFAQRASAAISSGAVNETKKKDDKETKLSKVSTPEIKSKEPSLFGLLADEILSGETSSPKTGAVSVWDRGTRPEKKINRFLASNGQTGTYELLQKDSSLKDIAIG